MSPDEVIQRVSLLGIDVTRPTLLRYENQGLIPKPARGGGGTGGRWTDYPESTVAETYAAWCLLHGDYGSMELREIFGFKPPRISPEAIKTIRNHVLLVRGGEYEELFNRDINEDDIEPFSDEERMQLSEIDAFSFIRAYGHTWWMLVLKAKAELAKD